MTAVPGETPETTSTAPRLSILHIMLWTLCSAFYLALVRAINAERQLPNAYLTIQSTSSVMQGVVSGATLAAAIVLVHARFRSSLPLGRHPGHWLVLIMSAATFTYLLLVIGFIRVDVSRISNMFFLMTYGSIALAQGIGYLIASWSSKRSRWRPLFATLAMLEALRGLFFLGMFFNQSMVGTALPTWGRVIVTGWMMVLSVRDLRRGESRDWLHWTGIAAFIATTGISLFWMIGAQFFRR